MEPFFVGEYIIYPLCKDDTITYYKLKYTSFINKDREYWAKNLGEFHVIGDHVDRTWGYSSAGLSQVPVMAINLRSVQDGRFFYGCNCSPEDIIVFSEKLEDGTEVLKVEPSKIFTKDEKEGMLFRDFRNL